MLWKFVNADLKQTVVNLWVQIEIKRNETIRHLFNLRKYFHNVCVLLFREKWQPALQAVYSGTLLWGRLISRKLTLVTFNFLLFSRAYCQSLPIWTSGSNMQGNLSSRFYFSKSIDWLIDAYTNDSICISNPIKVTIIFSINTPSPFQLRAGITSYYSSLAHRSCPVRPPWERVLTGRVAPIL